MRDKIYIRARHCNRTTNPKAQDFKIIPYSIQGEFEYHPLDMCYYRKHNNYDSKQYFVSDDYRFITIGLDEYEYNLVTWRITEISSKPFKEFVSERDYYASEVLRIKEDIKRLTEEKNKIMNTIRKISKSKLRVEKMKYYFEM